MYKITLPIDFSGYRYGVHFFQSVGMTDDERIVALMRKKGFAVEDGKPDAAKEVKRPGRDKKDAARA